MYKNIKDQNEILVMSLILIVEGMEEGCYTAAFAYAKRLFPDSNP